MIINLVLIVLIILYKMDHYEFGVNWVNFFTFSSIYQNVNEEVSRADEVFR